MYRQTITILTLPLLLNYTPKTSSPTDEIDKGECGYVSRTGVPGLLTQAQRSGWMQHAPHELLLALPPASGGQLSPPPSHHTLHLSVTVTRISQSPGPNATQWRSSPLEIQWSTSQVVCQPVTCNKSVKVYTFSCQHQRYPFITHQHICYSSE